VVGLLIIVIALPGCGPEEVAPPGEEEAAGGVAELDIGRRV